MTYVFQQHYLHDCWLGLEEKMRSDANQLRHAVQNPERVFESMAVFYLLAAAAVAKRAAASAAAHYYLHHPTSQRLLPEHAQLAQYDFTDEHPVKATHALVRSCLDHHRQQGPQSTKQFFSRLRASHEGIDILVKDGDAVLFTTTHEQSRKSVLWDDIIGHDAIKDYFQDMAHIIRAAATLPYALSELLPKGVLLIGPPGVGKTTLARAFCTHAGMSYHECSMVDFASSYVYGAVQRLEDAIVLAAAPLDTGAPCAALFIDELEAATGTRDMHDVEGKRLITALNLALDGKDARDGLLFIGATNRPDLIDAALLRPGRFCPQFFFEMPDHDVTRKLLHTYFPDHDAADVHHVLGDRALSGASVALLKKEALRAATLRHIRDGTSHHIGIDDILKVAHVLS